MTDAPMTLLQRLARALAAIVAGNVLYFFVAWPRLPEAARHRPFALDAGLAIDFAICVVVYVALGRLFRRRLRP
ncbi:MAG: hypothetical protein LAO05_03330 [Acidobacteriia bacterium]|nr:hypothetical protein [Terriglobia bacterium]